MSSEEGLETSKICSNLAQTIYKKMVPCSGLMLDFTMRYYFI